MNIKVQVLQSFLTVKTQKPTSYMALQKCEMEKTIAQFYSENKLVKLLEPLEPEVQTSSSRKRKKKAE